MRRVGGATVTRLTLGDLLACPELGTLKSVDDARAVVFQSEVLERGNAEAFRDEDQQGRRQDVAHGAHARPPLGPGQAGHRHDR